jgi:hypothetical protein
MIGFSQMVHGEELWGLKWILQFGTRFEAWGRPEFEGINNATYGEK